MRAIALLLLLLACTAHLLAEPDEVDKAIAAAVPKDPDVWLNGMFVPIPLPADAAPEKIVANVAHQEKGAYVGQFEDFRVVASKKVKLSDGDYLAILVVSGKGSRTLILAQYKELHGDRIPPGWWHRTFPMTTVP